MTGVGCDNFTNKFVTKHTLVILAENITKVECLKFRNSQIAVLTNYAATRRGHTFFKGKCKTHACPE